MNRYSIFWGNTVVNSLIVHSEVDLPKVGDTIDIHFDEPDSNLVQKRLKVVEVMQRYRVVRNGDPTTAHHWAATGHGVDIFCKELPIIKQEVN